MGVFPSLVVEEILNPNDVQVIGSYQVISSDQVVKGDRLVGKEN